MNGLLVIDAGACSTITEVLLPIIILKMYVYDEPVSDKNPHIIHIPIVINNNLVVLGLSISKILDLSGLIYLYR